MTSLSDLLRDLANVRTKIAVLQKQLAPLSNRENDIRFQLQKLMQNSDTRSAEAHGLLAVRSYRNSVEVTNKKELENALREVGMYDQCSRLDLDKAKEVAVKREMPGVVKKRREVFAIKKGK